jgi:hypothetical protein
VVRATGERLHIEIATTSWLSAPKVRVLMGTEELPPPTLAEPSIRRYVAEVAVPKPTRKRPIVVLVECEVDAAARAFLSGSRMLAFTNPIWVRP